MEFNTEIQRFRFRITNLKTGRSIVMAEDATNSANALEIIKAIKFADPKFDANYTTEELQDVEV